MGEIRGLANQIKTLESKLNSQLPYELSPTQIAKTAITQLLSDNKKPEQLTPNEKFEQEVQEARIRRKKEIGKKSL
ncbi:hypothetical protein [Pedobacter miscanthi]|uniref:hypothetical protein n=1 Tax=Pedobacter miscanthi TaxID=2259170 RepID=UPI00292E40FA|nr:hypothetical protein [Pedobacter miscanthi]